jgi:hypothetical protein
MIVFLSKTAFFPENRRGHTKVPFHAIKTAQIILPQDDFVPLGVLAGSGTNEVVGCNLLTTMNFRRARKTEKQNIIKIDNFAQDQCCPRGSKSKTGLCNLCF